MSKKLWALIMPMLAMMFAFTFAACGDDNNEPDQPDQPTEDAVVAYEVTYAANIGDFWTTFYDLEVTVNNAEGQEVTSAVSDSYNGTVTIPVEKAPKELDFEIDAKVKKNLPSYTDDQRFDVGHGYTWTISEVRKSGEKSVVHTASNSSTITTSGSKVASYLENHPERELVDLSYTLK